MDEATVVLKATRIPFLPSLRACEESANPLGSLHLPNFSTLHFSLFQALDSRTRPKSWRGKQPTENYSRFFRSFSRHQYGISVLVSQTSFRGETNGGFAQCRLFTFATFDLLPSSKSVLFAIAFVHKLTTSVAKSLWWSIHWNVKTGCTGNLNQILFL